MVTNREDSILEANLEDIRKKIEGMDYQIIKAIRAGVDVDELYPLHRADYARLMAQFTEIEQQVAVEKAAKKSLSEAPPKRLSRFD